MTCEPFAIKAHLMNRLEQKGVDPDLIPGLLRLLANSIFVHPQADRAQAGRHLKFLGWEGFELDEHTFQLVTACFELEKLESLKSMPPSWFSTRFAPRAC